jgi:citronellol/citronellal dehydrogenase
VTLLNSFQSVFRPNLFAGQTVLVTGGGSGIGRCTAHELASLGADLALVGRKMEKLETAQSKFRYTAAIFVKRNG